MIKITIEYDEETGKHRFETNAEVLKTGAAIATAMRGNGVCSAAVLAGTGAYLSVFNNLQALGERVMDVAAARPGGQRRTKRPTELRHKK